MAIQTIISQFAFHVLFFSTIHTFASERNINDKRIDLRIRQCLQSCESQQLVVDLLSSTFVMFVFLKYIDRIDYYFFTGGSDGGR